MSTKKNYDERIKLLDAQMDNLRKKKTEIKREKAKQEKALKLEREMEDMKGLYEWSRTATIVNVDDTGKERTRTVYSWYKSVTKKT